MARMNRRTFIGALGAGAAGLAVAGAAWGKPRKLPNFVFILADDLGRHQVRCYGNPFYETPNLDSLAAQGVKFSNAYAACPVCSPTRASIMTGKYPARLHITDYIPGDPYPYAKLKTPDWTKELPTEEVTLAEKLKSAGYATGHFGKWHLARENDARYTPGGAGMPETQGFDDVLVTAKPASKETAAAGADPDYDAHHARAITDRAVAFIRSNKDRPFFCYIAHNLIHRPEMEYAPAIVKYAQKPEAGNDKGNNPVLGAMVETLDKQIGRVLTALDELGLADNTVVVFFSDNGDFYGRERHQPFHGHKADLYEGGIRMPLIVRWPNAIEAGSESDALACSIDFLPTFAELAGVPVEDGRLDGVSLVPVLRGGARLERDTLFWHYPHYHSIGLGPSGAIRKGKYKLIEWFEKSIGEPMPDDALELYDLESDPGERHNLASIMPEKTRDLHARLRAWRRSIGAQEMELNPNYDPARAAAIAALM